MNWVFLLWEKHTTNIYLLVSNALYFVSLLKIDHRLLNAFSVNICSIKENMPVIFKSLK